jgi:hypothetical protein
MPLRVLVVHDDHTFVDSVTDALRAKGHEVIADPHFEPGPPQKSDIFEVAISQAKGAPKGLRFRVIGLGALGAFLHEPVTVEDTVRTMESFLL